MILFIILSVCIIFLSWILFGPVILYVNTDRNIYHFTLPGIISIRLIPNDMLFRIRGWILFVPFRFNPFARRKPGKRNRDSKPKKRKMSLKSFGKTGQLKSMIRSIRIRRMDMDIDTGDVVMNAWLVPAFTAINNYKNMNLRVNFEGKLIMQLEMRTRIGSILWNFLNRRS